MTFSVIASGSSGNCYLLESAGQSLLIEAGLSGPRIREALWKRSRRVTDLSGCLISHAHGDHSKGAMYLDLSAVDLYMSKSCAAALKAGSWAFAHTVDPLTPFLAGEFRVNAFALKHDADADCLGFVVDAPDGERLCYISDARFTEYKVPGVTHWAVEANYDPDILRNHIVNGALPAVVGKRVVGAHMSIDTTIDLLKANDLSKCERITLLHLSDGNSNAADFIHRVQSATGVPVDVAGWRHH